MNRDRRRDGDGLTEFNGHHHSGAPMGGTCRKQSLYLGCCLLSLVPVASDGDEGVRWQASTETEQRAKIQ
ncbi:unnamed protein product [Linum trigynum]|uniref:Uncharacterized protein n=1 Tax=Linum trigynum TaxID=586398 RepID=A0AAV2CYL0_9ROSI